MRKLAKTEKETLTQVNESSVEEQVAEISEIEADDEILENTKNYISPPPNELLKIEDVENLEIYETDNESDFFTGDTIHNHSDKEEQISRKKFEPQKMFENIRQRNLYPVNLTAKVNYQTLSCRAQPFLRRISIVGEFF